VKTGRVLVHIVHDINLDGTAGGDVTLVRIVQKYLHEVLAAYFEQTSIDDLYL